MLNGNFNVNNKNKVTGNFSSFTFELPKQESFTNSVWLSGKKPTPTAQKETPEQKARQVAQRKTKSALERAKGEVRKGVIEQTPNDSVDIRKYRAFESPNHRTPVKSTAPYCASFVSWCYGNDFSAFGYEPYTPSLRSKAKKAGCYTDKSKIGNGKNGTYKPKSGDLLMWINKDGNGGHVGIIESCRVLNGKMYIVTIEGNTIAKGQAETATTKAQGEGPEGVMRKVYSLDELRANQKVNGVVRMEEWLAKAELNK